jgi:protoporphyrinogen oxidase
MIYHLFACSGVDVPALLERIGISERLINPLRDSSAGYIALAYALYKIATPIRYTITLGILHLLIIIKEFFVYGAQLLCLLSEHL